jgi:hypothetical protein
MARALINLTGLTFGEWTVINRHPVNSPRGEPYWNCICSCGTRRTVLGHNLRAGVSTACRSCGTRRGHAKRTRYTRKTRKETI